MNLDAETGSSDSWDLERKFGRGDLEVLVSGNIFVYSQYCVLAD